MKYHNSSFKQDLAVTIGIISLALFQSQAMGAPGALSDQPLYVGPAVEPNIFLLSDDSGSMDWEVMTTDTDEDGRFTGTQPDGTSPAGTGSVKHRDINDDGVADCGFGDGTFTGYLYIVEFGSNTYTDSDDCNTADDEAWRIRNSDFNPLYFDPSKTYEPWEGVDINGNAYSDASITNAPDNPYNPQEYIDLTQHNSNWLGGTLRTTSDRDGDTVADGFRYYTWSDTDGDGKFDDGEETEYLIKDQDAATQQNFANWFVYHRSREFVAKYAFSKAVTDLTGARVGYGTIHNHENVNIEVASMNLDPSVGNKKTLFDKIYSTHSASGTPLRQNLEKVGKYFDFVDGSLFGDVSASPPDYADPILPAADYGMCQKNVTILMTDGFYNGSNPSVGNADADDTGNAFDGGDYADNHPNTLADVAMYYYKNDLSGLNNEVPTSSTDSADHQHMNTYTVAFGVTGTLDPDGTKTPSDDSDTDPSHASFEWPNPNSGNAQKIDDLWHAAFNGRGDFYSAQNPSSLINAIEYAITSAAKGTSSAAAVAFNTTTLDTGAVIYQAKFNPSENWKGELTSTELNADGTIASSATWNAGDESNNQSPSSKVVLTYKRDTVTPANSDGVAFKTLADLSADQQADLNMGPSAADGQGQARIDYLRGDRTHESQNLGFRDRTNVLGDIVHSNPVYVGPPQSGYPNTATFGDGIYSDFVTDKENRDGIIYVGANDGMLHGFNEADGSEAIAYVPNALFSSAAGEGLHYLTDPTYSHRYYVDLSPTVLDVYINSAWKTVLVGGLRAGGRGIFALDITDPSTFSDANAGDIVMWEFDSTDDADLGYTFSKPTIALLENGEWAAIFGNGYNSTGDGQAELIILYLDAGLDGEWSSGDYIEIKTGVGSIGDENGLSTPAVVDSDGDGRADRVYAGDIKGNLWAFDISGSQTSQWGVAYKQGNTPKPLFIAEDASSNPQPITSKPIVADQSATVSGSPDPNLMVFFGTGQFIVDGDKTTTGTQSFYGVWDDGSSKELTRTDLTEQTLSESGDLRTTSTNTVVYDNTNSGWFHDLPTSGERVIVNPKVRGNFVRYNTLIPGSELCKPEGYGWLMSVKQIDGTMGDTPYFDVNGDGNVDASDSQAAGVKMSNIPAGSNNLGDMEYTPDDEGNVDARKVDAGISSDSGRLSWQELFQ